MTDESLSELLTEVAVNQKWLMDAQEKIQDTMERHTKEEKAWQETQDRRYAEHGQRLGNLEAELYFRKKLGGVFKMVGGAVILALTFKFGDIGGYLDRWLK